MTHGGHFRLTTRDDPAPRYERSADVGSVLPM